MANSPANTSVVSFAADIVPLFRPMDIQCMRGRDPAVFLADYTYMSAKDSGVFTNATTVLEYLKGDQTPRMPFGGPYWSDESLSLLQSWIDGGCQP
ncbi:MAG TPA: hypothetical protein VGL82_08975 [Bryobacteraceae bacterium]|jgi:hypothetical protein